MRQIEFTTEQKRLYCRMGAVKRHGLLMKAICRNGDKTKAGMNEVITEITGKLEIKSDPRSMAT